MAIDRESTYLIKLDASDDGAVTSFINALLGLLRAASIEIEDAS